MSVFQPQRINRALSAFDHVGHRWAAIPLRPPTLSALGPPARRPLPAASTRRRVVGKHRLSLTSWSIQASPSRLAERSELILDHLLGGPKPSDIIFLQEVAPSVRQLLLDDPRVRSGFLTADASNDDRSPEDEPFTTMALLSNKRFVSPPSSAETSEGGSEGPGGEAGGEGEAGTKLVLDSVSRVTLLARFGSDALCVDIRDPAAPGGAALLRLLNVHLEPSSSSPFRRMMQTNIIDGLLREDACSGGVIAGDFDARDPEDGTLMDKAGRFDGKEDGRYRGADAVRMPRGLDKVIVSGVELVEMEVLTPGRFDDGMPWSDHCELRCTLTV